MKLIGFEYEGDRASLVAQWMLHLTKSGCGLSKTQQLFPQPYKENKTPSLDGERPPAGSQKGKPATGDPPDIFCPVIFTMACPAPLAHSPPTQFILASGVVLLQSPDHTTSSPDSTCQLLSLHLLFTPLLCPESTTWLKAWQYLWPQPPTFGLRLFMK